MLGMFKDEAGGKQIIEFVSLRAKLYSYEMLDGTEDKNVGGVKECYKRSIQFDKYRASLFSRKGKYRKKNVIRSHSHQIYTEEINKIAHTANDNKRVIMADGIHTLAYGHANLKIVIIK